MRKCIQSERDIIILVYNACTDPYGYTCVTEFLYTSIRNEYAPVLHTFPYINVYVGIHNCNTEFRFTRIVAYFAQCTLARHVPSL